MRTEYIEYSYMHYFLTKGYSAQVENLILAKGASQTYPLEKWFNRNS
jgi:hypothetical protein